MSNLYPDLTNLIGAYLNQDYSHYSDTLEGVIDTFKRDATAEQVQRVHRDIAAFRRDHPMDLETAFSTAFGTDFDPTLWGITAASFIDMLDSRLAGSAG